MNSVWHYGDTVCLPFICFSIQVEEELEKNLSEEFNDPDTSPFIYKDENNTKKWVFQNSYVQLLHFVQEEVVTALHYVNE